MQELCVMSAGVEGDAYYSSQARGYAWQEGTALVRTDSVAVHIVGL